MSTVVVSGSAGFIGGYVVEELLNRQYSVVGIDNYSKYGRAARSYDDIGDYKFVEGDAEGNNADQWPEPTLVISVGTTVTSKPTGC